MNLSDQEIGKKIKQYRKGKMTQQELAEKIGKTESSIRKYEKGLVTIPLNVLEQIASSLGITAFDLMGVEYWDKKPPNMGEEVERLEAIIAYYKDLGYTVDEQVVKCHWEDENEVDPSKRVQIVDEVEYTLTQDGHTAVFTQAEFEALQAGVKEVIEGKFYKKVLEQQKKK